MICESAVNKLKDNQLGYEFIKNHHGQKVEVGFGKTVEIFSVDSYERFVKEQYAKSGIKMKKLLMDDIPEQFIERQLNDSRYISKVVKGLLSEAFHLYDLILIFSDFKNISQIVDMNRRLFQKTY